MTAKRGTSNRNARTTNKSRTVEVSCVVTLSFGRICDVIRSLGVLFLWGKRWTDDRRSLIPHPHPSTWNKRTRHRRVYLLVIVCLPFKSLLQRCSVCGVLIHFVTFSLSARRPSHQQRPLSLLISCAREISGSLPRSLDSADSYFESQILTARISFIGIFVKSCFSRFIFSERSVIICES